MAHVSVPVVKLSSFYGPWVLFMAILFWASSLPGSEVPSSIPDYVLHTSAYFLLGLLTVRAFARGIISPRPLRAPGWLLAGAVGFSVLFGVSDEWHQSFVPGREPSLRDLAFDGLGALVAASLIGVFWRRKQEKRSQSD